MKFYKLFIICLVSSISYGQYDVTTVGNSNVTNNNSGLWIVTNDNSENIDGSLYLLDNWDTKGYLTFIENKSIKIIGLNYDTKNDAFVAKVAKDSVFMFDDSKLKEVILENKRFKKYFAVPDLYHNSTSSYLEVLAVSNDIEFLKHYGKKLILGKKDPLTQVSPPDKYVDISKIYFKSANVIQEIKLNNKKQFYNLFGSKSKEIKKFISKNKISLRDENNLQKILNYYNTL